MKHHLDSMTPDPRDNLWECIDCWEAFDYWPSDMEPRSGCPGEPTPLTRTIRNATTALPDVVKGRMERYLTRGLN